MKVQVTKQLLESLYNNTDLAGLPALAEALSNELGVKITPIRASQLFNSVGLDPRRRKRGSSIKFVVINEEEAIPDAFQMTSRDEFAMTEIENEQYSI